MLPVIGHKEVFAGRFLHMIFLRGVLVDAWTEVGRVMPESDVHQVQEFVHATNKALRRRAETISSWSSIENYNVIG